MRKNGYQILDNIAKKIPKMKGSGAHYGFWLEIKEEEYYFKVGTPFELYAELFCEELGKILGIPVTSYDLAYFEGLKGVISKNINPNQEKEIKIGKILKKYYNEVIYENPDLFPSEMSFKNAFNLETIWWSLYYYYQDKDNKEVIVKNLMKQIVNSFYFQILTFNYDMNYQNIIILGDENPRVAPNFDNGGASLVNFDMSIYNYFFPATPHSMKQRGGRKAKDVIQDFLQISDDIFVNELENHVDVLLNLDLDSIIKKIEIKTESPVPDDIRLYLISNNKEQWQTIKDLITETKSKHKR